MDQIDFLVDDLIPVAPHRDRTGRLLALGAALSSIALLALSRPLRPDLMAPPPLLAIAVGLMLVLAMAAGLGAVRMARPQVGASPSGAAWATLAVAVLPLAALGHPAGAGVEGGLRCVVVGLASGLLSLAALGLWLKRGAPVRADHAAWLVGLSAGSVGALAVTLECPIDGLAHIGFWHVAVIPAFALAARAALPRLIAW